MGLAEAVTRELAEPVRLREPGAALRARGPARSELRGLHRRGDRSRVAGGARERRPRVPALHQPARDGPRLRAAEGEAQAPRASSGRCCCRAAARRTSCSSASASSPNAILVGSQSFWEGVDVKGEQLSVVVIDRLPFNPPDDPVLAACIERINRAGRQRLHGLPGAARGDRAEAGRGAPDPRRDRPRGADDLRPAAGRPSPTASASGARCRRSAARARIADVEAFFSSYFGRWKTQPSGHAVTFG